MKNLVSMLLVLVITVVVPLVVLLGIWANILPQSLQVSIGMAGVFLAAAFIVVGNVYLMYSDIKTGRYKKNS
ncbi:hypothetical protein [Thiomicrorhabdus aquaedulcis]|uniref:hypothetical protein n=1 Tax=Thiomicrorhabdus aquaedulcis TaxID=2211106 RepID=UPI000FDA1395|nr:hypothetical protein [Thiomicrorhabdus aquaedulcis]